MRGRRLSGGTFDFVVVFFFKCGPGHAKGAGGKALSGTATVLEPYWIHYKSPLAPWLQELNDYVIKSNEDK